MADGDRDTPGAADVPGSKSAQPAERAVAGNVAGEISLPNGRKPSRLGDDFHLRIASGLVIASLALAATWLGTFWFTALMVIGGVLLLFEWSRITRGTITDVALALSIAGLVAMVVAFDMAPAWFAPVPGWLIIGVVAAIALQALFGRDWRGGTFATFGLDYIALPVLAMLWLRADPSGGLLVTVFLFVVVWGTDIMGYVAGRYFGGPKLIPAISPKKTWSGAIGGTAVAVLGGAGIAMLEPEASFARMALLALVFSLISQAGDLFESAIKRRYDVKDSGALIPGHGGLLDRVDGLLFAAVGAALFALLAGPLDTPARTILVGSAG
ncbi:MAG: phosphatidate cytidylyltransferase [Pseudomonadota bacterium]